MAQSIGMPVSILVPWFIAIYCNKPQKMFTVAIIKLQNAMSVGYQRGLRFDSRIEGLSGGQPSQYR